MICGLVGLLGSGTSAPRGFSSVPPPNFVAPVASTTSIKVLNIPNDKVGLVIGRSGDTIKQIQVIFMSTPVEYIYSVGAARLI
jgi:hypothetical protein